MPPNSQKLRIAFLTNEFISEHPTRGGLGNYLNRITQTLKGLGHAPEVFVISKTEPRVINFNGIRVERVPRLNNRYIKFARKVQNRLIESPRGNPVSHLAAAMALAHAFERRHHELPFHFLQCADGCATGLFVKKRQNCPLLIRLSSKRDLWYQTDGCFNHSGTKIITWLEKKALQRADIAYAPSKYVSEKCREHWRGDVLVLRPPLFRETKTFDSLLPGLPEKYLIHFGQIGARKGSDLVARALCKIWKQEPNFKMIWAGKAITPGDFEQCHQFWGEYAANVIWLGPVKKEILYTLLKQSITAVLPSRVDNLPNTVIESLMFGIPVIGSKGASIDEIVEPGLNGELVDIGDIDTLTEKMLQAWRMGKSWIDPFVVPSIFNELEPKKAAMNLIRLAGYDAKPV
jgi:glycosyltransferase involved in cell wall biosynthesis